MIRAGYLREDELNFEVLVLKDEDGATLELQRSLVLDAQDRELGMDTHCLVSSDGASLYGAVAGWQLIGAQLTLRLTAPAADELALPPDLSVTLDEVGADLVRRHLPRILGAN